MWNLATKVLKNERNPSGNLLSFIKGQQRLPILTEVRLQCLSFYNTGSHAVVSDSVYSWYIVCKVLIIELIDCSEHFGNDSVLAKICLCLSICLTSAPLHPLTWLKQSTQIKEMFVTTLLHQDVRHGLFQLHWIFQSLSAQTKGVLQRGLFCVFIWPKSPHHWAMMQHKRVTGCLVLWIIMSN